MATKRGWLWMVALLGLLQAGSAKAGPYLGDWGWCWHPDRNCPRREYSPLHHWLPEFYYIRQCVQPANLDQFPPGPTPCQAPTFEVHKYRCRTAPPAAPSPYADPAGYYGR